MKTEKRLLKLTFVDEQGRSLTLSVPNPKGDLTAQVAQKAGEDIVSKNVIIGNNGLVIGYKNAKIVTTVTEVLA